MTTDGRRGGSIADGDDDDELRSAFEFLIARPFLIPNLLGAVAIGAYVWFDVIGGRLPFDVVERTGRHLVVVGGNERSTYDLEPLGTMTVVGAAAGRPWIGRTQGYTSVVHSLTPSDAEKFYKTHAGTSQCPAPFFNDHARQTYLIPRDEAIARKIAEIGFAKEYGDTRGWKTLDFKGQCARRVTRLQSGEGGTGRTYDIGGCSTFVVDDVVARPWRSDAEARRT